MFEGLGSEESNFLSYPTWILLKGNGVGPQIIDGNLMSQLSWENQFPPPPDAGSQAGQIYGDLRKRTGKKDVRRIGVTYKSFLDFSFFFFFPFFSHVLFWRALGCCLLRWLGSSPNSLPLPHV